MSDGIPEFPRLRPGLAAAPDGDDPRYFYLFDQLRVSNQPVRLSRTDLGVVRLFNGRRSLAEIQAQATLAAGGLLVAARVIEELADRLDEALFLDSPRFHDYVHGPDREPSCVNCYTPEPRLIRARLKRLFTAPDGPGMPGEPGCRVAAEGRLRAALVPHIDYGRGGVTYGWGFKELVERTDASLFVIVGTAHYSAERYTLTRKNFKTPLGTTPTDQDFIDRLVGHYGDGLFDDPFAHLPEHSIELEVLLLQYLLEGKRPFRLVPLVVGPFADCVEGGCDPGERDDVRRMVEAMRKAEAETREPVCYVISGDLAHIGPKFSDPDPVDGRALAHSLKQDRAILQCAEAADATGYFRTIAAEKDARRICGLPPTFTVLEAARPARGKLLHHGHYLHPEGFESVSFASMAFE